MKGTTKNKSIMDSVQGYINSWKPYKEVILNPRAHFYLAVSILLGAMEILY